MKRLVWVALGILCIWGVVRAIAVAYADILYRRGTVDALAQAVRIAPGRAAYRLRYAQALERAGGSSSAIESELRTAIALNGRSTEAFITASLRDEMAGNASSAESLLKRAEDIDHQFKPMWALANFYFREGDAAKFWPEARKALALIGASGLAEGQYDPGPIFNLSWQLTNDGKAILDNAIPPSRLIQMRYLSYLITNHKLAEAGDLAARLLPEVYDGEVPVWMSYVDVLIAAHDIPRAEQVWKALLTHKVIHYDSSDSITNEDFAQTINPHGFDWRLAAQSAVPITQTRQPPGLLLEFNGQQPEHLVLVEQVVPVGPGRHYHFKVTYGNFAAGCKDCFHWRLLDVRTQREIASLAGSQTEMEATTPNNITGIDLQFTYDRAGGERQFEGAIEINRVELAGTPL